jgi:hypothetical protein
MRRDEVGMLLSDIEKEYLYSRLLVKKTKNGEIVLSGNDIAEIYGNLSKQNLHDPNLDVNVHALKGKFEQLVMMGV